jgi:type III secretory pathway component EscV
MIKNRNEKKSKAFQMYFFSFSFLFCMLNLGPLIFVSVLILISVIIPNEYGEEGTLSSKQSILIHEFVILPVWSLITFWGLYLSYKMVSFEFHLKKQKNQEKSANSSESQNISITDKNSKEADKIEENANSDQEKESNPYLAKMKKKELTVMNTNPVIIPVTSQKDQEKLKKIKTNDTKSTMSNDSDEIRSSFENMNGIVSNNNSNDHMNSN